MGAVARPATAKGPALLFGTVLRATNLDSPQLWCLCDALAVVARLASRNAGVLLVGPDAGTVEGLFSLHKDLYSEVEQASLMQQFQAKVRHLETTMVALACVATAAAPLQDQGRDPGI